MTSFANSCLMAQCCLAYMNYSCGFRAKGHAFPSHHALNIGTVVLVSVGLCVFENGTVSFVNCATWQTYY